MKIPSKVTPYKESTIAKFPVVLAILEKGDMTPTELYAGYNRICRGAGLPLRYE